MEQIKKNENGQSVIEFILTFTVITSMLFFFFRMALGFTNGYMVHYATFMASRAYLTNDNPLVTDRDGAALIKAKEIFKRLLPEGLITDFDGELKANDPESTQFKVFTGLYAEFHQVMSGGVVGGKEPVYHRSESFLGREPARDESLKQICKAISMVAGSGGEADCSVLATLDDNGY